MTRARYKRAVPRKNCRRANAGTQRTDLKPASGDTGRLWRQARLAAIVVLAAAVSWVFLSWLGGKLEWPYRYAFLLDFSALAAFLWAIIVVGSAWRKARTGGS